MAEKRIRSKKYTGVYILQQKNGDISYSILYKNAEGNNQRETIGLKSEGVSELYAYNKRIERINQVKHGGTPSTKSSKRQSVAFEDVWNFYLENKALTKKVKDDYRGRWNKHMKQDFSQSISLKKLLSFRARLRTGKKLLSERSIDMMISMMGAALRYWNARPEHNIKIDDAVAELRTYDKDHVTKREKRKRNVKRLRYLETSEINLLKQNLESKHPDLMLFVAISLSTGARLGSVMLIKKKDIIGNKITLIDQKDGDDRYIAYLNSEALKLIQQRMEILHPNDPIFTLGQIALEKRLQRILNKLFNRGLDSKDRVNRVVVHTLRHTFASHLVMQGTPLTIVQKLLNHSEIETTTRYAHLATDAGQSAVLNLWE